MKKINDELYREMAEKIIVKSDESLLFAGSIDGDGWYLETNMEFGWEPESGTYLWVITYWHDFAMYDEDGNKEDTDFDINKLENYIVL